MRLRLINAVQQLWRRNVSSFAQRTAYLGELQKLQNSGYYTVYVGKTELSERHFYGDVQRLNAGQKHQPTWSIIHAGGELGWVPWNYKLYFYLSGTVLKPDKELFSELCSELNDHYGSCAIILNPYIMRRRQILGNEMPVYSTAPVELLPMTCCPKVAQDHGHKMLHIPMHYAHLSPLNTAWSTVKWFMTNNRDNYTDVYSYRGVLHKVIRVNELVDKSLNEMTQRKWVDTVGNITELLDGK
ncbi:uncharacterized protein C21orf140 homolog [Hemibagrus wyckioides]|uniref:uncharacterized protein C21orf140 homolog n=1 Tax=Hemibagrus wyckioides TaxID=337641 RepID=UPI00266CAE06|nr:uncharacterized protein C21orf140 homolog [Hemibagrus wyckioides]